MEQISSLMKMEKGFFHDMAAVSPPNTAASAISRRIEAFCPGRVSSLS